MTVYKSLYYRTYSAAASVAGASSAGASVAAASSAAGLAFFNQVKILFSCISSTHLS